MDRILAYDDEILDKPYFELVCKIVTTLIDNGVVDKGAGHCISMSTMLSTLLSQNGLKNTLVECQLVLTNKKTNSLKFVGYDSLKSTKNSIDTHVVVVTHTQIPMLIDLSIGHYLPDGLKAVISKTDFDPTNNILANVKNDLAWLTYEQKSKHNIHALHQNSILERIETDLYFQKQINFLKNLNYVGIGLGLFSILNSFLITFGVLTK